MALGGFVALASLLALPARFVALTSTAPGGDAGVRAVERRVRVLAAYPHDPGAFTQGLVLERGVLYESTGLEGRSTLRRVDLATGRVDASVPLAANQFGEGLARVPGLLIQLTWTSEVALLYDQPSLRLLRTVPYEGEGWGLCYDGARLVMSDGTERLTFRRPDTFAVEGFVDVTLNGRPVGKLNELECAGGSVYANVWHRDTILRIDPASGRVLDRIDASGLLTPRERAAADVLNGIAHDPADGAFYVTGKLWPRLFKVRFE
jgi:glutaminyl-peptide cyclotransferase